MSAKLDVTFDGKLNTGVNSGEGVLIGTATGFASNKFEGTIEGVLDGMTTFNANVGNVLLQLYQKVMIGNFTETVKK